MNDFQEQLKRNLKAGEESLAIGENGCLINISPRASLFCYLGPRNREFNLPIGASRVKKGLSFQHDDSIYVIKDLIVEPGSNLATALVWDIMKPEVCWPKESRAERAWAKFFSEMVDAGVNPYDRIAVYCWDVPYHLSDDYSDYDSGAGWYFANRYNTWWMEKNGLIPETGWFRW